MTTFYTKNFRTTLTRLCLVFTVCFTYIFVNAQCNPDVTAPVAVCDALTQVALPSDGTAILPAEVFDDGSFDNCCAVTLQVRREGSTCPGNPSDIDFGDTVTFCCEDTDANANIFVILQVSDCNGNTNNCFTEVVVEDKLSPVAICPSDTTITCSYFYDNFYNPYNVSADSLNTALAQGLNNATIFDNCETNTTITSQIPSNSFCEDFSIVRTWTVNDGNPDNASASCSQIVTVEYDNVWSVDFPVDITVNDFGMSSPDFAGAPIYTAGSCGIFAQTYSDEVLPASDNCAKIIRTWTVINWCSSEVMEQIQVINIEGGAAPAIVCPSDFVVYTNADGYASMTIPLPTTVGNINNYTVTATSDLPNFNANSYSADSVLVGTYSVTFTVTDFCENDAICTTNIQVEELGNSNCPVDTTINCDVYQNELEDMLSQLAGDPQAQNESLDQFFGAPSFQGGLNISSSVAIDIDGCGQGTLTRTWELDDAATSGCFTPIAASTSGNNGDQVCVDVTIDGFEDILSFQYTMNFDPTILAFNTIVDSGNIPDLNFGTSNVNSGNVSVLWFDEDATNGKTFADGTLMYQICFDVIGGSGQIAEVTFSGNPTQIEVTNGDEDFVCFDNIPSAVAIGLSGPNGTCFVPIASSTTADVGDEVCLDVTVNGMYNVLSFQFSMNFDPTVLSFTNIETSENINPDINFNFTPVNDGDLTASWFDAINADGTTLVNGSDLLQICFEVIGGDGQITEVSFSGNPTPTEIVNADDDEVCFLGIAGQININNAPPPPPSGDCFTVSTPSETVNEGEQLCLDVTVDNFDDILSFQYSMNFNPTALAFSNINDPGNIPDLTFGTSDVNSGELSVLWFDEDDAEGETYPDGTLMYQVCFDVIGSAGQISTVSFSGNPTTIEVTNGDEELVCFGSNAGQISIEINGPDALVVNSPPTVLCTQVITLEYTADWSAIFPQDTVANCSFGVLEAGEPEIIDGGCGLFGVAYEDVIFNNQPGGGYEIQRTWTIINWCDESVETHTQVITVNDDAAPNFVNNCNLPDVCLDGNQFSCTGGLTIPMPEVLDCSNDIDLTATSDLGDGFGPFVNVEPDFYLVTFTATDPFGNTTTCVSNINVVDCTAPVAVCKDGLIVTLLENPNGDPTTSIFATDLDDGSYDNCSTTLDYSFAANIQLSTLDFDCSNLGSNNVALFVTDEYGNQNSCLVNVIVEDPENFCPADPCAGSSIPNLVCNDNIQVSLDQDGNAQFLFEYILEGISPACIDALDLSFSPTDDVEIINYDCSNLGTNTATVYLTLDNGQQNSCWGIVTIADQIGACGDPLDCDNDVVPPTPYCKDGLIIELMHVGDPNNPAPFPQVSLWADDVDEGSFDNCTNPVTLSFSPDVNDTELVFNCDNLGENSIQLWVTDASGLQSFCETFVIIQMNSGSCGSDPNCFGNTIPPVAICDAGLIANLDLSGEAEIFATDIDEGSYDDCSAFVQLSFSENTTESSTTFNCDDLGDNPVILYVTDENGNQSQCWTTVTIQDNLNACDNECLNDVIAPEAFCASGLVIQMPSTGMLTLSASIFNIGSIDNCTNDLIYTISTVDNDGQLINGPATGLPFNVNNVGANNVVLTVTDAAGNSSDCSTILFLQSNPPAVIRGKIFMDENDDCTYNAGEMGLDTWQVKLEAINDTLATDPGIVVLPPSFTIDSEGNYTITLPDDFTFFTPDSSTVNVNNLNPYLRVSLATGFNYGQNCDYNYFINSTTNVLDTVEIDFPVQVIEDCPQLSVDVTAPYLRRCFDNNYAISYCNYGNIDAADAYIEVDFDEFLDINNSTLPWTSIDGTTYRFDLGTVPAAECGSFVVNATVNCDAVLGQTHCVQANIYPDVLCDPMSPQWSGASIDITGECDGDEVRFIITNVGDNDMDDDVQFIVIEDFIMYNTGTFNLVAGGSTEIVMPANGSTWRLEADQVPNHPGSSKPSLAIEGCTVDGNFSLGMVTQFAQNDDDPFVSINCMENIGSFDPNDKTAIVTGYGDEHYINQNTDIEYLIRFQNTGTDTAFNVVVIDTLDANLDPLSVRAGASSHPYDFTILGDNVLKFNFDNIALPDSNINVALSQGFVKFRVSQYPDVALETVIENNAAIYFDFNEPIITNVVFHTIGQHFIEIIDATSSAPASTTEIKVFPNPFDDEATIEITGLDIQNGLFKVFDMQGRLVKTYDFAGNKFSVKREELPSGMYFYQLESKVDGLMTSGKLVIK